MPTVTNLTDELAESYIKGIDFITWTPCIEVAGKCEIEFSARTAAL